MRVSVRIGLGVRVRMRIEVQAVSTAGTTAVLYCGPFAFDHAAGLTPTPGGSIIVDELRWRAPLVVDAVVRRLARRVRAARATALAEAALALVSGPVVVATAIVRDGRVLVAQRTRPPELAGQWELPGGRVEAGEPEDAAVIRECREELGTAVRVTGRLGTDLPIRAGVLRVHRAELVPGAPEPRALEHAQLRWVAAAELRDVNWVEADRAVVADLVGLLASG